jgi:hypothetical protein
LMIFYVTMAYGPFAAFLLDSSPAGIRSPAVSLPYTIGNGIFGGMTPFIAMLLTSCPTGDKLVGLWYPMGVAAIGLVLGAVFIPGKKRVARAEKA